MTLGRNIQLYRSLVIKINETFVKQAAAEHRRRGRTTLKRVKRIRIRTHAPPPAGVRALNFPEINYFSQTFSKMQTLADSPCNLSSR